MSVKKVHMSNVSRKDLKGLEADARMAGGCKSLQASARNTDALALILCKRNFEIRNR